MFEKSNNSKKSDFTFFQKNITIPFSLFSIFNLKHKNKTLHAHPKTLRFHQNLKTQLRVTQE